MIWAGTFGIVDVVVVLALMVFATWKKTWIRILASICIIVWGAYTVPYDIKYAAPLVALGSVLFFSGIFNLIRGWRQE